MKNKPQLTVKLNGFYFILSLLAIVLTLNFSYAGDLVKGGERYKAETKVTPAVKEPAAVNAPAAEVKKEIVKAEAGPEAKAELKSEVKAEAKKEESKTSVSSKATYMGDSVCIGCHKAVSETMTNSFHSRRTKQSNLEAAKKGCESCHGPASEHVNSGGNKDKIISFKTASNDKKVNSCMQCHTNGERMQFGVNAHNMNNISCESCHKIHAKTPEADWKKEAQASCEQCHKDVVMEAKLPSRHPVKDGRMQCSDCHNPHGAGDKMLVKNTANELCKSCHAEIATSHVYAHPPVNENCLNCHKPHGSANRGLLTQRVPMLCLQCHGNVSSSHDITVRTRQDCTNNQSGCHGDIHGSNSNNLLLK